MALLTSSLGDEWSRDLTNHQEALVSRTESIDFIRAVQIRLSSENIRADLALFRRISRGELCLQQSEGERAGRCGRAGGAQVG